MNILKKISGKTLYAIAKAIGGILDFFIGIIGGIVGLVSNIGRGFIGFIGTGGCLLLMIMGPFGIALLLNPLTLLVVAFLIIFPILGTKFVSYLRYVRYTMTEFLFDSANNLIDGKEKQFQSFNEYGNKYKKMEEDKRRREQQQRQAEQQRLWEERFKQWNEYQSHQGGSNGYGGYNQNSSYGNNQTYVNPTIEFKNKYEKSCNLLGIEYDVDKYKVKLAYRQKAKEYHPDINKSPDATKMFQQINDAYEFLSDNNIERYKSMR